MYQTSCLVKIVMLLRYKEECVVMYSAIRKVFVSRRCEEEGVTWKQHYKDVERDSKREIMTSEELCSMHWTFSDGFQRPIFQRDGGLLMENFPSGSLKWSFNQDNSLQVYAISVFEIHSKACGGVDMDV